MCKKRFLVLMALCLTVSLLLASCGGAVPPVGEASSAADVTEAAERGTSAPAVTVADTAESGHASEETDPPDETSVGTEPADTRPTDTGEADTTSTQSPSEPPGLLYYEDFEGYGATDSTTATIKALGWKLLGVEDGLTNPNTSAYRIEKHNGSYQLYIENYTPDASGNDSYAMILTAEQFGYAHQSDYTLQYDLEYTTASNLKRYITIVTEYSNAFYNSFHFRNSGYGNNQCHFCGEWLTYDVVGDHYATTTDATSDKSIAYKLLGKYYDGQTALFSGVSVSVRCVMDWENGHRIYMRVNDPTSYSGGNWVLVSAYSPDSTAAPYLNNAIDSAAVVLKTGGAQNGYIDNIIIWSGTGEEPEDKTSPYLTSRTSGHDYRVTADGVAVCGYCGKTRDQITSGWYLEGVPAYDGGRYASGVYACGQGTDPLLMPTDESYMQLISRTDADAFEAYLAKLEAAGFDCAFRNTCEDNIYALYTSDEKQIYTYYTAATKSVRVIDDRASRCTPETFGYAYEKVAGDTTVLYQYGMPMNENLVVNAEEDRLVTNGMMYVIKLADNSVFIIDGGVYKQFDENQTDGFMRFLEEITGAGEGGTIRIAGWFITHSHGDHMSGFCLFMQKYADRLSLERVLFNFPSVYSPEAIFSGKNNTKKLVSYIDTYFGDDAPQFLKPHTGEILRLADISIQVLYTHEDIVSYRNATTEVENDFNNSSTVLKITFDGKTFLVLGDINIPAMNQILQNYTEKTLRVDVIQLAHHVINNVAPLYHVAQASVVLVPQSPAGTQRTEKRRIAMAAAAQYAREGMIFYASRETVGIRVVDGRLTQVFSDEVHGGPYVGNWTW